MSKSKQGKVAHLKHEQLHTSKQTIANIYRIMDICECKKRLRQVSIGFWGSRLVNGLTNEERGDYALFFEMMHDMMEATSAMDILGKVKKKAG